MASHKASSKTSKKIGTQVVSKSGVRRRVAKKSLLADFDKYAYYHKAVQSVGSDVRFLSETYADLKNKKAKILREDFCAAFALSAEWVKASSDHVAYGVDIDPEPMEYGRHHYLPKLKPEQQKRLHPTEGNVLTSILPKADIAAAMNFSYFCFKSRTMMKAYFANVLKSLNKDGIFVVDIFGGSQCHDAIEDKIKHKTFTYFWDQSNFDPVTNFSTFYIHFKVGAKKYEKVFTYDWRMWSIPEIRELMEEVGFTKTHIFWEGTNAKGAGNGVFTRTEHGESCLSWIAYIIGEK